MSKHLLGAASATWLLIQELGAIADALEFVGRLVHDGALVMNQSLARYELAVTEGLGCLLGLSILLFVLDGVVVVEGLAHRIVIDLPLHLLVMLLMLMVFVLVQICGSEVAAKVAKVLDL